MTTKILGPSILFLFVLYTHCSVQKKTTLHNSDVRSSIIQDLQSLIGSGYQFGGKTPQGFDCSGLVYFVMRKQNIAMHSTADAQSRQGQKISMNQLKPGDLLFFKRKGSNRVFHVSIVEDTRPGEIWMIHASSSKGVIRENLTQSSYWKPKLYVARSVIQ